MHPVQIIFAFLLFVLVTSKEVLWYRPWVGNTFFNASVAGLFVLYFIGLFGTLNAASGQIFYSPILSWERRKLQGGVVFLVFTICLYLLGHEAFVHDDYRALKMVIYLLFFLSLLSSNVDLKLVAKIFVWAGVAASIAIMLQAFLIAFLYGNDLSSFPRLPPQMVDGRTDGRYTYPFFLGYINSSIFVDYGLIGFYRACSLTTEAKYCTLVLWAAVFCLFYLSEDDRLISPFSLFALAGGLLMSHAYASFGVLGFAFAFRLVGERRNPLPYLMGTIAVLFGVIKLMFYLSKFLKGFYGERISSFVWISLVPILQSLHFVKLFGTGVTRELAETESFTISPITINLVGYGWIGFGLRTLLILLIVLISFRGMRLETNRYHKRALALGASLGIVYLGFFGSEYVSPLFCFLFAAAMKLVGDIEKGVQWRTR